jgi:hypothetical protein
MADLDTFITGFTYLSDRVFLQKFTNPYTCEEIDSTAVLSNYFSIKSLFCNRENRYGYLISYNEKFVAEFRESDRSDEKRQFAVGLLLSFLRKYNRKIWSMVLRVESHEDYEGPADPDGLISISYAYPMLPSVDYKEKSIGLLIAPDCFSTLSERLFNQTPENIHPLSRCCIDFYFQNFVCVII